MSRRFDSMEIDESNIRSVLCREACGYLMT